VPLHERGRRRWIVAIALSTGLVAAAPYVGDLQRWLRTTLGSAYVPIVNGVVGVTALAGLLWAASTIRDRMAWRLTRLVTAAILAAMFAWWTGLASAESNAVERFHFLEYGVITLLFFRASASVLTAVLAALAVGAADEWMQHLSPVRIGEGRDIFLNLGAIVCGALVSVAVITDSGGLNPAAARRQRLIVALLAAALIATFVWTVHRGFVVADDEMVFESRFDAAALLARSSDPAAGEARGRFGIENQYVTEAIWHVQARNERWSSGDVPAAWGENRILEKYFASALARGHAWPEEQRADAARRLGTGPAAPYRSAAARLWIFQTPW
jgi:hypothetical protein